MNMAVYIEPHERAEAIDAYRYRLSEAQIEAIEEAPDTALICLRLDPGDTCTVTVIPEG